MKYRFIIFTLILCNCSVIKGQTKADLEEKRQKAIEEINYVDNILKSTEKEKVENINYVNILEKKVGIRQTVINGLNEEIDLLNKRILINQQAIEMMEDDMEVLRTDYTKAVLNYYKYEKQTPELAYILSARDFNQGYKRLKYLKQISEYRRNESETIEELKYEIEKSKKGLEDDLSGISELKQKEVRQKELMQNEQRKRQNIINNLGNKEKQLRKELEAKKKIEIRIEGEIERIIAEEKRKNNKNELTPEQKLIGSDFESNRGRLPWPVERGIITSHFGVHQHPVLKYVTENNFGIEITSSGKTEARSIFKGEVSAITAISGANMTVIIRHGNYLSVYTNLINVKVRKGEKVDTKQVIGEVYKDTSDNDNAIIKFMIFNQKYLDPELWIAKN